MNARLPYRRRLWLAGVAVLALAAGVTAWTVRTHAANDSSHPATASAASSHAKSLSSAFRIAADQVLPSVVAIETRPEVAQGPDPKRKKIDSPFGKSPFGDLFRDQPQLRKFFDEMPETPDVPHNAPGGGLGSGVIIDSSGVILTNNHVVASGGSVLVRLHDGREFKAAEVKTDPKTDLAVVRIEGAKNLRAARLGNSDGMEVGDWVLALGQPFGLESTVTAGIISAKHRGLGITARENFLQTDAAINPGNSGGPLVNLDGEVIGINTAISSRSGGNQGVGFAVPANLAKWVSRQLIDTGTVKRAYLGVGIQPITQQLADHFHVQPREGVAVTDVQPGTPAAKAGLKLGDVIVSFSGQQVAAPRDLQNLVEISPVGKPQSLMVIRDGERMTLKLSPEEQPAEFGSAKRPLGEPAPQKGTSFEKLGFEIGPLDHDTAAKLGLKGAEGVLITAVRDGSPAANAGLDSSMVITQINKRLVRSVEEARTAISDAAVTKGVLLLVKTGEGTQFLVLKAE